MIIVSVFFPGPAVTGAKPGDEATRDELTRRTGGYVQADVDTWLARLPLAQLRVRQLPAVAALRRVTPAAPAAQGPQRARPGYAQRMPMADSCSSRSGISDQGRLFWPEMISLVCGCGQTALVPR